MSLWLRIRGATYLLIAIAIYAIGIWVLGERGVQAPSVVGNGPSFFLFSGYLSLFPALVLARGMESRTTLREQNSVRPILALDILFIATVVATMALLTWLISRENLSAPVMVRNSVSISLLVCLLGLWVGSVRAGGVAIGCLIVTQSYSPQARGAHLVRIFQEEAADGFWRAFVVVLAVCTTASLVLVGRFIKPGAVLR